MPLCGSRSYHLWSLMHRLLYLTILSVLCAQANQGKLGPAHCISGQRDKWFHHRPIHFCTKENSWPSILWGVSHWLKVRSFWNEQCSFSSLYYVKYYCKSWQPSYEHTVSAYRGGGERGHWEIKYANKHGNSDIRTNQAGWQFYNPSTQEVKDQEFKATLGYIRESKASLGYLRLSQKTPREKNDTAHVILIVTVTHA